MRRSPFTPLLLTLSFISSRNMLALAQAVVKIRPDQRSFQAPANGAIYLIRK